MGYVDGQRGETSGVVYFLLVKSVGMVCSVCRTPRGEGSNASVMVCMLSCT